MGERPGRARPALLALQSFAPQLFLGHPEREQIEQIGEPPEGHVHDFAVLERFRGWKTAV